MLTGLRFEAAWLTRDDYDSIWKNAWQGDRDFSEGLSDITRKSKAWNEETFGNIFRRKRLLQARIKGLQQSPNYNHSGPIQGLEKGILKTSIELLKRMRSSGFKNRELLGLEMVTEIRDFIIPPRWFGGIGGTLGC